MANKFRKHYTREEARALLPQIRNWLEQLHHFRKLFAEDDAKLAQLLGTGYDIGGPTANRWVKSLASMKEIFHEFEQREIQLKDLERGLIDFPSMLGGREVFLCWEKDEEDIEYWHELNTGYTGRERIPGEEGP